MNFLKGFAYLSLSCLLLQACATYRINQFKTFSEAGKLYTEAMIELTEEVGNVAIDADSAVLMTSRDTLTVEERTSLLESHTEEVRKLLTVLHDIREHTLLLKRYFSVLSNLAEPDASAVMREEAIGLTDALLKLSPRLKGATIGEAPVMDFMGGAVPLTVAQFQQAELERELRENAPIVERQLELQHAVLTALAGEMKADLDIVLKQRTYRDIAKPYISEKKLPKNWMKQRREVLSAYVTMASLDNAARAAEDLKKAFVALVERKIDPEDFSELFAEINAMVDIVELAEGSKGDQ
jgi:hypothetical protein